jgi:sigma-B regulation protein RsbU (phosphoserine phosphatase)
MRKEGHVGSVDDWEYEIGMARKVMESLVMPRASFSCGRYQVQARMQYAGRLGGDYYGVFTDCPKSGHLAVFIGDVAGKGVSASLSMVSMMILLREASVHFCSPSEVLTYVNRVMTDTLDAEFFNTSVFYISLDCESGVATYSRAGHESAIHFRAASGECRELTTKRGPLLGVIPGASFNDGHVELLRGDKVVLYTDGLIERREYGETARRRDFLTEMVAQHGRCECVELVDKLLVELGSDGNVDDDQTLLVLSCA